MKTRMQMSSDGDKAALETKIKNIDQQIAVLQELKVQCLQKLHSREQTPIPVTPKSFTATPSDNKATIFQSYFHGREDIYAKLWVNNRTGKRGYSPAYKNEWVRSLCRKPAVKCSECPNQQFLPFDESAIRQHLEGRQVIGVYPMLTNEACHLIVIDFDKENWMDYNTPRNSDHWLRCQIGLS